MNFECLYIFEILLLIPFINVLNKS